MNSDGGPCTNYSTENRKIAKYNYDATKLAIQRAMKNSPAIAEIIEQKDKVEHPFAK